jgi:hypothetical protein
VDGLVFSHADAIGAAPRDQGLELKMQNLANTFAALPDARATDVIVAFGDFASTTVSFMANTAAAREFFAAQFGRGAVEANIRKSSAPDFAAAAAAAGLKVA